MDTKQFLEAVVPEGGLTYVILTRLGKKGWKHIAAESAEKATQIATRYDKGDVQIFFACAAYKEPSVEIDGKDYYRIDQNWYGAKAFWVDVDVGEGKPYADKKEASVAIKKAIAESGLPAPMIVDSGGGYHLYWLCTKTFTDITKWKHVANALFKAMAATGLQFDTSRTRDPKSVLRPIGTTNRKGNGVRPVALRRTTEPLAPKELYTAFKKSCIDQGVSLDAYEAPLPEHLRGATGSGLNYDEDYPDVPKYADDIAEKCQQIRVYRDVKGDVDYPLWRITLGVLGMCEDREKMYDWSEGHAEYDRESTDYEWAKWEKMTANHSSDGKPRPARCSKFQEVNAEGCEGCPYAGKIATPLQLGIRTPEGGEEDITQTVDPLSTVNPDLPEGYVLNRTTLSKVIPPDNQGNGGAIVPFSNTLVYPTQRLRKPDGTYKLSWVAYSPHGEKAEFSMCSSLMNSPPKLLEEMGRHEVTVGGDKSSMPLLTAYLRDSVERLKQRAAARIAVNAFGWTREKGFALGNRIYMPDGSDYEALLIDDAANNFGDTFVCEGSREEYVTALKNVYQEEGNELLQYLYCSGFGSMLSGFASSMYSGIIMLITGKTSQGKTTVCHFNLAAFGRVKPLMFSNGSEGMTENARQKTFGTLQNLPVLLDEFTVRDVAEISRLAYGIVEGKTKQRLKADSTMQDTLTWAMTPYVTSNVDLQGKLEELGIDVQAQQMRMIHMPISMAKVDHSGVRGRYVSQQLSIAKENCGWVGVDYVRYLVSNREAIKKMVQDNLNEVTAAVDVNAARYMCDHWACTIAAAQILKNLGVLDIDMKAIKLAGIELIRYNCSETGVNKPPSVVETLQQFLDMVHPNILTTQFYLSARDGAMVEEISTNKEIVGRHIKEDEQYGNCIFLRSEDIRKWCFKKNIDPKWLQSDLKANGLLREVGRKALGRGLNAGLGKTLGSPSCWVIDYGKFEELSGQHVDIHVETKVKVV